jgi:hypothetical protein
MHVQGDRLGGKDIAMRRVTRNRTAVATTLWFTANAFTLPAAGQAADQFLSNAQANCDQQAQQQTAAVMQRKAIEPTDVLAWPLLFNDLAIRRQQESNQPRLLAEVEQQRQRCYLSAQAAATQRAEESRKQVAERNQGYQRISIETFALDGKEFANKGAKVSMTGMYIGSDTISLLFSDTRAVILATRYPNLGEQPNAPLLVDNASREFRKRLLECRSNPACAQVGCPVTVLGVVTTCTLQKEIGAAHGVACLSVEDGR